MSDSVAAPSAAPAAPASTPSSAPSAPSGTSVAAGRSTSDVKAPPAPGKSAPAAPTAEGSSATPAEPKVEAAKVAAEKRKYKIKVDQQESEVELTDDQIAVELQMAKAARKRMQESAQLKKEFAELKELAKTDPALVLRELAGIKDPKAWAMQQVEEQWKLDVMPEAERKALEQQREVEGLKKKLADYEAAKAKEHADAEQSKIEAKLEADFKRAFEVSGLPWDGEHLEAFGKLALESLDYGIERTPEQMAAEVKEQLEQTQRATQEKIKSKFLSLKGGDLLSALGDDVVKEVLRAAVERHRGTPPASSVPTTTIAAPKPESGDSNKPYRTSADWDREMREMRRIR